MLYPMLANEIETVRTTLPASVLEWLRYHGTPSMVAGGILQQILHPRPGLESVAERDIDIFMIGAISPRERMSNRSIATGVFGVPCSYESNRADTFTISSRVKIQFIYSQDWNNKDDVLGSFDFSVVRAGFWWEPSTLEFTGFQDHNFTLDNQAGRLRYDPRSGSHFNPLGSLRRMIKYVGRGFSPDDECLARIIAESVAYARPAQSVDQVEALKRSLENALTTTTGRS